MLSGHWLLEILSSSFSSSSSTLGRQSFGEWFNKLRERDGDTRISGIGTGSSARIITGQDIEETQPLIGGSESTAAQVSARLSDSWNFLRSGAGNIVVNIQESVAGTPRFSSTVDDAERGSAPAAPSSSSTVLNCGWATISRSDRFKGFLGLLVLSAFFFILSTMMLSVVLLAPSKFAVSFTLGSACFMGSFALLQGPWSWFKSVCSKERLPFTLSYFGSMGITLYACLSLRSYVLTLAFSSLQLLALAWYGSSYVPGGRTGMYFVTKMLGRMLKGCVETAGKCLASRMMTK